MKILERLLGKQAKPNRSKPGLDERIQRLRTQTSEQRGQVILGSQGDEKDLALREALINESECSDVLGVVASEGNFPSSLEKASRQRLAQLIDEGKLKKDQLIDAIPNAETLLAISAFSQTSDFEEQVLTSIDDQALLIKLCEQTNSTLLRQSLASRIQSEDALRRLAKNFKQKDKNAYRIVKTKLDAIRAEAQQQQKAYAQVQSLVEEIQHLSERFVDIDYPAKLDRIERRWSDLQSDADDAQQDNAEASLKVCRQKSQAYLNEKQQEKALEEKRSRVDLDRKETLQKFWKIVNDLFALEKLDAQTIDEYRRVVDEVKVEWQGLKDLKSPPASQNRDYVRLTEAIEFIIGEYAQRGTLIENRNRVLSHEGSEEEQRHDARYLQRLIDSVGELGKEFERGETISQTESTLEKFAAEWQAQKAEQQKTIRIVGGMIKKATEAASQGKLRQALGIRHSIDEKSAALMDVPANISRQLETLDEQIEKLIDWQSYAVIPKKKALIEDMRALVGSEEPAEALATKIKHLQDAWKELSQSGPERSEELWQEFSELGDQAFEPCKAHFQKLADIRKHNFEKRQELVNQLETFYQEYDWDNADWPKVESLIRSARSDIRKFVPVERSDNKKVMEKFDAAIDKIHEKLNAEFEKNKAAKQLLIDQAEKLVEAADLQWAIDGAKRLQAQWKTIGRCHYRDQDKLWKVFRVHCDAIFARKSDQDTQRRAETDAVIEQARACVDGLNALLEKDGDNLLNARNERDKLVQQFADIENVPEKVYKAIQRDLDKAIQTFDKKVSALLDQRASKAWDYFFQASQKLNSVRLNVATDGLGEDEQKQLAEELEEVPQWPEGGQALFNTALKDLIQNKSASLSDESGEEARRMLCIRTEILADQPTPEEDKQRRMQYQVEMLQEGMSGSLQQKHNKRDLAFDWVKAPAVDKSLYQKLFKRFYKSWSFL